MRSMASPTTESRSHSMADRYQRIFNELSICEYEIVIRIQGQVFIDIIHFNNKLNYLNLFKKLIINSIWEKTTTPSLKSSH